MGQRGNVLPIITIIIVLVLLSVVMVPRLHQISSTNSPKASPNPQRLLDFDPQYIEKLVVSVQYNRASTPKAVITKVEKRRGYYIAGPKEGSYKLESLDENDKVLNTEYFDITPYYIHETFSQSQGKPAVTGVLRAIDETLVPMEMAYAPNIKKIRLLDDKGNTLSTKPVEFNAQTRSSIGSIFSSLSWFHPKAVHAAPPETCQPGKLCIVFLGDRTYAQGSREEFYFDATTALNQDAIEQKTSLLNNTWFRDHRDAYNVVIVNRAIDVRCNEDNGLCWYYSRTLLDQEKINAHIIVVLSNSLISDVDYSYGWADNYWRIPLVSMDGYSAKDGYTIVHELGHALGGLRDEYVYPNSNGAPDSRIDSAGNGLQQIDFPDELNCYIGTPPNPAWPEVTRSNYHLGCSRLNWWRSSLCSIMGCDGLSIQFNPLSEQLMNQALRRFQEQGHVDSRPTRARARGDLPQLPNQATTPCPELRTATTLTLCGFVDSTNPTTLRLAWNAMPNTSRYVLRVAQKPPQGAWSEYTDIPGFSVNGTPYTDTTFTYTNGQSGTTYAFVVNALDATNYGGSSNVVELLMP